MLILLAATGLNNYAKTTGLYLQTVYQQFLLGNHTVRCTTIGRDMDRPFD